MLILNNLFGFGAGGRQPATVSFRTSAGSPSDTSTYTFSSLDIGAAASNRYVVVIAHAAAGGSRTTSTVTIAGVSATIHVDNQNASVRVTSIAGALVPTGTTGDIIVTYSNLMTEAGVGVYALYGLTSTTPHHTALADNSATMSINIPKNGILIAGTSGASSPAVTWSGATQDYDFVQGFHFSGASGSLMTEETGRVVDTDHIGQAMVAASWA